jgi:hypothetical protein
VEAFVRHEALTVVSRKVADEANVFVEVYPQFDGEFSEYYGAGLSAPGTVRTSSPRSY